uniref:UDP-N-acetylglucosamine transferase subunit ALG13 n=1 Tax=Calcidiscus leptoporus TaxID=127549 RepID=A0A7S0J467_9EUKA|mmetsp:Transcript_38155/g.89307  ORF Transcript_38155/g.89307 Transcript_38155/m.89307 type:complete len:167 (+) Transcript_38155:68-568(+)
MAAHVYVTVGTTQFDSLIDALLTADVLGLLVAQGYRRLLMQIGRGREPVLPAEAPLTIEWYRFKDSLAADMHAASLLISHAGAGSIMEGLGCAANLLVVVNDSLMHNHQQELAHELDRRGHLIAATPASLLHKLAVVHERAGSLVPFPESDHDAFSRFLSSSLGLE